ncbi:MAG: PilZ domain-containing protein [Actinomycetota bacterium]|nr:PilZ domain-containing protein [Actinomycetota bacterium]
MDERPEPATTNDEATPRPPSADAAGERPAHRHDALVRLAPHARDVLSQQNTCVEVLPRGASRSILALTAPPDPGPRLRPCRRPLVGPVTIFVGAPGGVLKLSAVVGDPLEDSTHPLELIRLIEKIERRGHPRVVLPEATAVVRLRGHEETMVATAPIDVSLGGVALRGVDVGADAVVVVELALNRPSGPARLECEARVVHRRLDEHHEPVVGCEWVEPSSSFRNALSSIVSSELGSALRR